MEMTEEQARTIANLLHKYPLYGMAVIFMIIVLVSILLTWICTSASNSRKAELKEVKEARKNIDYMSAQDAPKTEEATKEQMRGSLERKRMAWTVLVAGLVLRLIIPAVGAVVLIAGIVLLVRNGKEFTREAVAGNDPDTLYRRNYLVPALRSAFGESLEYNKNTCITDPDMYKALPEPQNSDYFDGIEAGDYVSFNIKENKFEISEQKVLAKDDEGTYVIFDGTIYKTGYKRTLTGHVRIVPTKIVRGREVQDRYPKHKKLVEQKIETDNILFNEHFDVYATSREEAIFVLNPIVINYFVDHIGEELSFYAEETNLYFACHGKKNKIFVAPKTLGQVDALSLEGACQEVRNEADAIYELVQVINGRSAI